MSEADSAMLTRRASEIQTSVTPPLPKKIKATLRPYQETGYHFLAYLTTNRFGGILADDMGLGKTLQALTWLAWMHQAPLPAKTKHAPTLVVCPKSVMDNWRTESARFFPTLKVQTWSRDAAGAIGKGKAAPDLLIIHYQQLRQHERLLQGISWLAVILDEAQYIKNPTSQTAKSACALRSQHRLALSGTPVENRLLDLWSIMNFAQPGALGSKSYFTKNFDAKADPLARRRLAARVRPFLLRRTKKEVASDLPERTEEDLIVEMDGTQAALYKAELKRARVMLLKANTSKALDGMRFHILSSLLRLRQICCHPTLIGTTEKNPESAKVEALMDLLEPLMEEGYKVLIFSQFVEMLEIIKTEITQREWPHFLLTGSTDDRGPLVEKFQAHEGNAVFLISLKAGGAGLNLTAASYVVLFDPWWNPAVEAQAIDRTHRIGQTQNVIAYRLLVKDSIEEKIRQLQKQKSALAGDVLGEDAGSALTLDDFKFLLGGNDVDGEI
jgi:SNF2 family DNA or RNA helicase